MRSGLWTPESGDSHPEQVRESKDLSASPTASSEQARYPLDRNTPDFFFCSTFLSQAACSASLQ